jgi:carbamoyl-phosphate synthase small subunit
MVFNPDGYFLSNGPGDPEPLSSAIQVAKDILSIINLYLVFV